MYRTLTIAATAALLLAPAAQAQTPAPDSARPRVEGRGPMGRGMMGQRRAAMAPRGRGPAAGLLAMRERLNLTDDQARRLEALASAYREPRPDGAAILRARADLLEATRKDDLAGARAAMDRMSRLRTDVAVARLQARKSARDVLTAEQRTRLESMRGEMQGRRGEMRGHRGQRGMRGMRGMRGAPGMGARGAQPGPRREMRMREGRRPTMGPPRLTPRPPQVRRFE